MLISQALRPHEVVRFNSAHYGLAPIAGLQMRKPAVAIGDLILLRCNRAEWETVERGYVFKDWHSQYYDANPVFLYKPFGGPIAAEDVLAILDELTRDGTRLVSALRLYKIGHLLEPAYTIRFLVSGTFRHRKVDPYRTEYLAMPLDGLTWNLETEEVEAVSLIYNNLKIMEAEEGTEGLRVIIDQFNLSHTPTVPSFFSVHVLLTTLQILFDGVSPRLHLQKTLYDRALSALHWSKGDSLDSAVDEFYEHQILSLRNAVHHHTLRDSKIDLNEAAFHLQLPLMIGIRLLMRLHRSEVDANLSELKSSLGWQGLKPKDLLNGCLDRFAAGDPGPLKEIMKSQA